MTPRSHHASHASFHWRRAPAPPPSQVNRFQTRLKPIASFLDESATSGTSRWMRGGLPRQVLRRAKLTETAMRLAVLGLTKEELEWLRQQADGQAQAAAGGDDDSALLRAEIELFDEAFAEAVRQVGVHCVERGLLLNSIRTKHHQLFHKLVTSRQLELARVRAERTAEYKRSAYERMKDSGDLENLREQERLKEQRKQAYNVGDAETVERINKILAPDEPGRR